MQPCLLFFVRQIFVKIDRTPYHLIALHAPYEVIRLCKADGLLRTEADVLGRDRHANGVDFVDRLIQQVSYFLKQLEF